VIDCFLGLISLKDATAETLYDKVIAFFNLNKIPYKTNLIGFASDGANVMVGTENSEWRLFAHVAIDYQPLPALE